ncbi:hypothetical protein [Sphingomonas sp.]|uniref:hypothetical protein n=1 Tax=Sphingomonas sp. TaxID=28214 RepID=UPI0025D5F451|nr:hypothetical protein [Sphingomonas sp.]
MSAQSWTRRHPIAVGIASAVFIIVFVPAAMALQGYPASLLFNRDTLPKLILAGVLFGALMTGFVLLLRRAAGTIEPTLSAHKNVIWPVSIAAAALLYYFFGR